MKSLKNILPALLMALLASMTMVSCLDSDNDDNTLTPELEKQARTAMSNIYTGKLIFKNLELDATKFPTQVDTIKGARVKFAYSDSTAVVYSLPAKLLFKALDGNAIYDGVGTDGKPKLLPGGQLYSPTMEQSKLENILFVFGGAVK